MSNRGELQQDSYEGPTDPFLYETIEYGADLRILDREGRVAVFRRRERIRFLDDAVGTFIDCVWGDGILLAGYHAEKMSILDLIRTGNGYAVLLALPRRFRKGETFDVMTETDNAVRLSCSAVRGRHEGHPPVHQGGEPGCGARPRGGLGHEDGQGAMYDRPLIEDLLESGVGEDSEKYWRRQSIFPVERRWALVWEEVQENEETARRIRANPQDWVPVSFDQDVEELTPRFLDLMREEAARGLPH